MIYLISERFSRGQRREEAANQEVLSKIFRFSEYKLDADVKVRGSEITMEGEYAGSNFKMSLKPNGYIHFVSNHGKFSSAAESSSSSEFKEVLRTLRAEDVDVKRMIFKVWAAYRESISRRALIHKYEMPLDRVSQFELFLRSTEDLGASIIDSRVTIREAAKSQGVGALSAPLIKVYRRMFS